MIEYFKETVEKDTYTIVGWVYDGDDDSASALLVQRRIRQVALDRPQKEHPENQRHADHCHGQTDPPESFRARG